MAADEPAVHDPVSDEPSVYLHQPVTPAERMLGEQVGLSGSAYIQFWMYAKLSLRVVRLSQWIGSVDGMWRGIRRHARISLASLASSLVLVGGFVIHRVAQDAAEHEHAAAQERATEERLKEMREDLQWLRAEFRRLSGADPDPPTSDVWHLPDKVSSVRGPSCTAFASRSPSP